MGPSVSEMPSRPESTIVLALNFLNQPLYQPLCFSPQCAHTVEQLLIFATVDAHPSLCFCADCLSGQYCKGAAFCLQFPKCIRGQKSALNFRVLYSFVLTAHGCKNSVALHALVSRWEVVSLVSCIHVFFLHR